MRALSLLSLLAAAALAAPCPWADGGFHEPTLDLSQSGFTGALNYLYFVVRLPTVTARTYTPPYYIGNVHDACRMDHISTVAIASPDCETGDNVGPFTWNASVVDNCGFSVSTVGNDLIFTSSLIVGWTDNKYVTDDASFAVTSSAALPFQLVLHRRVTATTNITIYDPIVAHGVLSYIEVVLSATNTATVSVKMSATMGVQKPFDLINSATLVPTISGTNTIVKDTPELVSLSSTTTHYWKKFNYVITPGGGVSQFNKVAVTLNFDASCVAGVECPYSGAKPITAVVLLSTSSFTPKLIDTAYVNGTLGFWTSNTYTTSKSPSYWDGDAVYAQVNFTAKKVGIASWNRTSVTVNGDVPLGLQDLNWDGVTAANTIAGVTGSLAVSRFKFTARLPVSAAAEGSAVLPVRATYTVSYISSKRGEPQVEQVSYSAYATFNYRVQGGAASSLRPWF
eukprot:m51a1_g5760 hypothetical protein (453) ;mRNA; r:1213386-1214744